MSVCMSVRYERDPRGAVPRTVLEFEQGVVLPGVDGYTRLSSAHRGRQRAGCSGRRGTVVVVVGSWRWLGGCSTSRRVAAFARTITFYGSSGLHWFTSAHTLGSTRRPEPNQPAPRLFGGCDSDASLLIDHHHTTVVPAPTSLPCHRAVPRKPQSSVLQHD